MPNGDKTHTHVCTRDPSHTETKDCGDFWDANCTTPAMCYYCRGTHGETAPDKHDWWMFPESHGDGTHTYTCYYDSTHKKTEACDGLRRALLRGKGLLQRLHGRIHGRPQA